MRIVNIMIDAVHISVRSKHLEALVDAWILFFPNHGYYASSDDSMYTVNWTDNKDEAWQFYVVPGAGHIAHLLWLAGYGEYKIRGVTLLKKGDNGKES